MAKNFTQNAKNSSAKKVSVCIITYNQAHCIAKCIESVLAQSYGNFELIISDDSSTDGAAEIIKSFKDERILYVKTDYNIGVNGNLNLALSKANGDIIALIAGDDKMRKNHLEFIVDAFEKMSDVDVLYPRLCAIDGDDNYIKGENEDFYKVPNRTREENLYIGFMQGNFLTSPGMAMRKRVVEAIYPLPYSLVNFQDYAMHIDILIKGFKGYVLDDLFVDYRIFNDGKNLSLNNATATKREQMEIAPLLDYYLNINDIGLLKEIFKNEIKSTNIEPFSDTIPFFLGQMALLSPHHKRKEWGYHTIMKFLSDKKNFDIANRRYGFIFKDYLALINSIQELCLAEEKMQISKEKDKARKKYKKYKRWFKILLWLNLVFVLCLFYKVFF